MRKKFIAGNWKMHKTLAEARELASGIVEAAKDSNNIDVLIAPPYQLLFPMAKATADSSVLLSAQNCHESEQGAFTGEVSAAMVADTGAGYVIIGHSERRQLFGETNERLTLKIDAALKAGLKVIFCVGETLEEREADRTVSVVEHQLEVLWNKMFTADQVTIAYEPVWAIGTGKTATPEQAQEVHHVIRARIATNLGKDLADGMRIQYGGSVKPGNAEEILKQTDVDGALVGGACLKVEDFSAIMSIAQQISA